MQAAAVAAHVAALRSAIARGAIVSERRVLGWIERSAGALEWLQVLHLCVVDRKGLQVVIDRLRQ